MLIGDEKSDLMRAMTSMGATSTNPDNPVVPRSSYPETAPHVCLAFLSCCDRTDLLNQTIAGAIRHMEEGTYFSHCYVTIILECLLVSFHIQFLFCLPFR
jgi:hypothetical protein